MEQLNDSKISVMGLVIITIIGVIFIIGYYFKYLNNNHKEVSALIVDNSVDKYLSLISTENMLSSVGIPNATNSPLLWGAYVGDGQNDLADFENLVGKKVNLYADFESWENSFPSGLFSAVGQSGKTLIIFWEPNFGYDKIINGDYDDYIKQFAVDAKKYSYPIILVPFDEMNLNEEAWGYGQNNNTASKFITAWKHVHDLFKDTPNVDFGLAYNSVSIPNIKGNLFSDYYPGSDYVDYIGLDGFSFKNLWKSFKDIFDDPMNKISSYDKPIIIFSLASEDSSQKASWISDGLGQHIKTYKNIAGWVWFNEGGVPNWQVNSDQESLKAFRSILP